MKTVNWPARLQRLTTGKLKEILPPNSDLWLDGGHNPEAGKMVAQFLQQQQKNKHCDVILICGMLNSKDTQGYLRAFKDCVAHIYTTPVAMSEAGVDPHQLALIAHEVGLTAETSTSITQALQHITTHHAHHKNPLLIMICGSLYLAGEALKYNRTPPS